MVAMVTGKDDRGEADGDIGCCGYILMGISVIILIIFFPFSLLCSLKVSFSAGTAFPSIIGILLTDYDVIPIVSTS